MKIKFDDRDQAEKCVEIEGYIYAADVDRLMRLLREYFPKPKCPQPRRGDYGQDWICDACGGLWGDDLGPYYRPNSCAVRRS